MVNDASTFSLAYIYQRDGPGMYDTYFTDEEANIMANTIARLPTKPQFLCGLNGGEVNNA